jgi:hypothetical protein
VEPFKVGDRVRVTANWSENVGREGVIHEVVHMTTRPLYTITFDDGHHDFLYAEEIRLCSG